MKTCARCMIFATDRAWLGKVQRLARTNIENTRAGRPFPETSRKIINDAKPFLKSARPHGSARVGRNFPWSNANNLLRHFLVANNERPETAPQQAPLPPDALFPPPLPRACAPPTCGMFRWLLAASPSWRRPPERGNRASILSCACALSQRPREQNKKTQ